MSDVKSIYCCGCDTDVDARLTDGSEVYSHRPDLFSLPFWICDTCNNFVGCHHKTNNRTNPLGVIATKPIKQARMNIHALIDPIWKSKKMARGQVYAHMTKAMGKTFHSSHLTNIEDCQKAIRAAQSLRESV